eukprot:TRINITY_DN5835_c0_g1_i4.p1 TRINITY_DN5835_c0_g1~~TRINITY_DN5835_c0_g1_i4.p1  ORF type:complete len:390 (-),score=124.29 TRINITY_DN5835_c0_g1_i4:560-1729(-)
MSQFLEKKSRSSRDLTPDVSNLSPIKTCWTHVNPMNLASGGRKASYKRIGSTDLFDCEEYSGNLARYRFRIMIKLKKYSTYRIAASDDWNAMENTWNYCVNNLPLLLPAFLKKDTEIFNWICNHVENLYTIQSASGLSQRRDETESPKSSFILDSFFTNSDSEMEEETSEEDEELEMKDFDSPASIRRELKEISPEKEVVSQHSDPNIFTQRKDSLQNLLTRSAKIRLRKHKEEEEKGIVGSLILDEHAVRANSSEPIIAPKQKGWFRTSSPKAKSSLFGTSPVKEVKKKDEKKEEKVLLPDGFSTNVRKYFKPAIANRIIENRDWLKQIFHGNFFLPSLSSSSNYLLLKRTQRGTKGRQDTHYFLSQFSQFTLSSFDSVPLISFWFCV